MVSSCSGFILLCIMTRLLVVLCVIFFALTPAQCLDDCSACQFTSTFIEASSSVQEDDNVSAVCQAFGGSQEVCSNMASNNATVVSLQKQGLTAHDICTKLNVCRVTRSERFLAATTGVVQYFADSKCQTPGGGPPGLVANPFVVPLNQCEVLLSNGFSIQVVSCDPTNGVHVLTYPKGCAGPLGQSYSTPVGVCVTTFGINSIATCV